MTVGSPQGGLGMFNANAQRKRSMTERRRSTKGESAGVLIYRHARGSLELLLVHPGGPYWAGRDRGAWQIPKGEIRSGESAEDAAWREAKEELGIDLGGAFVRLGQLRQAGGKLVTCFAIERDIDASAIVSNMFEIEWPPGSGRTESFPEVDAARWFTVADANAAMLASQRPFLGLLTMSLA